jgi:hypothetical protein
MHRFLNVFPQLLSYNNVIVWQQRQLKNWNVGFTWCLRVFLRFVFTTFLVFTCICKVRFYCMLDVYVYL